VSIREAVEDNKHKVFTISRQSLRQAFREDPAHQSRFRHVRQTLAHHQSIMPPTRITSAIHLHHEYTGDECTGRVGLPILHVFWNTRDTVESIIARTG
jgi:hypothetical protein